MFPPWLIKLFAESSRDLFRTPRQQIDTVDGQRAAVSVESLPAATENAADWALRETADRSGYVRERAIRRLSAEKRIDALGDFIRCANDWVPQVRDVAVSAIRGLMLPGNAEAFVAALPDLRHLLTCSRAVHAALVSEVESFVLQPGNVEWILAGLRSPRDRVRRICFELTFRSKLSPAEALVPLALVDSDIAVRRWGANHLLQIPSDNLAAVLSIALSCRTAGVREPAVRLFLSGPADSEMAQRARELAFDTNASVRNLALDWLRRQGFDLSEILLPALDLSATRPRKTRSAILAIADSRLVSLLPDVLACWQSPFPIVRTAVLAAVTKLDDAESERLCMIALADPSSSVISLACLLLQRQGVRFDAVGLSELIETLASDVGADVALRLSRKTGKWERLIFLLQCAHAYMERSAFDVEISDWFRRFNRGQQSPSRSQLEVIEGLTTRVCLLSYNHQTQVRFLLKSFER